MSSLFKYYNDFISVVRSNCEARPNISRRQTGAEHIQRCFSLSWQDVCNPPKKTWREHKYSCNYKFSLAPVHYFFDNIKLHIQTTLMVWSLQKRKRLWIEPLRLQSGGKKIILRTPWHAHVIGGWLNWKDGQQPERIRGKEIKPNIYVYNNIFNVCMLHRILLFNFKKQIKSFSC